MKTRTLTAPLAAAILALTLTACSTPNTANEDPVETPSTSASSPSAAEQVDAAGGTDANATPSPTESLRTVFAFGETVEFEGPNPLTVTISAPAEFRPGQYAAGADQAASVRFDVTVTNTGTGLLDPAGIYLSGQSGGVEASTIFDSGNGFDGTPSTSILPGQSTTFPYGLSVADPSQLVVEISPGFEYENVVFTNVALG